MLSAAVFLAAGADKTSPITLDEVVNLNNYLGVNLWTYTTVRKVKTLTIKYFPFKDAGTSGWFTYDQGTDACKPGSFTPLLDGRLVTSADVPDGCRSTCFAQERRHGVNLKDVGINVCRAGFPSGRCVRQRRPTRRTPPRDINGCGGANWFTQAAEDARKTVWFLHNWRVPEIAY